MSDQENAAVDDHHGDWRPGVPHVRLAVSGERPDGTKAVQHRMVLGMGPEERDRLDPVGFVRSFRNRKPDFRIRTIGFRDHPSSTFRVETAVERPERRPSEGPAGPSHVLKATEVEAPTPELALCVAPLVSALGRIDDIDVALDVAQHVAGCPTIATGGAGCAVLRADDFPEALRKDLSEPGREALDAASVAAAPSP